MFIIIKSDLNHNKENYKPEGKQSHGEHQALMEWELHEQCSPDTG